MQVYNDKRTYGRTDWTVFCQKRLFWSGPKERSLLWAEHHAMCRHEWQNPAWNEVKHCKGSRFDCHLFVYFFHFALAVTWNLCHHGSYASLEFNAGLETACYFKKPTWIVPKIEKRGSKSSEFISRANWTSSGRGIKVDSNHWNVGKRMIRLWIKRLELALISAGLSTVPRWLLRKLQKIFFSTLCR